MFTIFAFSQSFSYLPIAHVELIISFTALGNRLAIDIFYNNTFYCAVTLYKNFEQPTLDITSTKYYMLDKLQVDRTPNTFFV